MSELPQYDPHKTYDWNYEHAPSTDVPISAEDAVSLGGDWNFCGIPVPSPLGIAAGPLLNGRWCLYYARLGFDVLTYKTVRTRARTCYEPPNLVPVRCSTLWGGERDLVENSRMEGSWAVSFGMPSQPPEVWRADVEWTRRQMPEHQVLSVSVVGTIQPGWTRDELAADYALAARWAVESGADCVEINLSCPNVSTCDGQLYQHPAQAAQVAAAVRDAIGTVPLICKVGHFLEPGDCEPLLVSLAPLATAVSMTNSIAATVVDDQQQVHFEGQPRGICGQAIHPASVRQVAVASSIIRDNGLELGIIGVGGVGSAEDVRADLQAGASAVHLATAVMQRPEVGLEIRRAGIARGN